MEGLETTSGMETNDHVEPERMLDHAEWIRGLAKRLIAEPADADDAAQDTWVASLRRPPATDRPLRPWLRRVLGNFARQRARGASHREARESIAARPEALPSAAELVSRAEQQRQLVDVVLELREPYRATILLRFYEGLEPTRIAEVQGVPAATVRSRIQRGLALLRQSLDARNGGRRELWAGALAPLALPSGPIGPSLEVEPSSLTTGAPTMISTLKLAAVAAGTVLTGTLAWQALRPSPEPTGSAAHDARVATGREATTPDAPSPEVTAQVVTARLQPPATTVTEDREPVPVAPTAAFGGTLRDAETGEVLPDFELRVEHSGGRRETVRTDAEGRFATATALPAGELRLHPVDHPSSGFREVAEETVRAEVVERARKEAVSALRAKGVPPDRIEAEVTSIERIALSAMTPGELPVRHRHDPATADPVEVGVPSGPTFRLTIENSPGADLTDATALLRQLEWSEPRNAAWSAVRGSAAPWVRFDHRVADFMSPFGLALDVRDASGLYAGSTRVENTTGVHDARVEITERAELTGLLVTAAGEPVPGLAVVLRARGEEFAEVGSRSGAPVAHWARTDTRGEFELGWIVPGEYVLHTLVDFHEDFGRPVGIEAGASTRTFVVDPVEMRTDLEGRVTSRSGESEAGVHVHLTPVDPDAAVDPTAAERPETKRFRARWQQADDGERVGRYFFGSIPPGTYQLTAEVRSFLTLETEAFLIELPAREAPEFVLLDDLPARDLTFTGLLPEGAISPGMTVRMVLDPDGERPRLQVSERGRESSRLVERAMALTVADVPLGHDFAWRVHAHGYQPIWGDQTAFAGGDELRIDLVPGWGTAIRVLDEEHRPVPDVEVHVDGELIGRTGSHGTLNVARAAEPTLVRVVQRREGRIVYDEETDRIREFTPAITVIMDEAHRR